MNVAFASATWIRTQSYDFGMYNYNASVVHTC
jgi:hypothetical protein